MNYDIVFIYCAISDSTESNQPKWVKFLSRFSNKMHLRKNLLIP